MNHKADEAYMAKMCHEGWAATSLVEGVWTFEPCKPDQYTFRVCYLRGKSNAEVEELKRSLAEKGIEFVSRYSFWAIFRGEHDFRLYRPVEELAICEKIYRPMPWGSVLSWHRVRALYCLCGRVYLPWSLLRAPDTQTEDGKIERTFLKRKSKTLSARVRTESVF